MIDSASVPRPVGREVDVEDIRIAEETYFVPTYSNLARHEGQHWSRISGDWIDASTYVVTNATPTTSNTVRRHPRFDSEEQAIIAVAYESYHASR